MIFCMNTWIWHRRLLLLPSSIKHAGDLPGQRITRLSEYQVCQWVNVFTQGFYMYVRIYRQVRQRGGRGCVIYEAAADMSVCGGRSDHRGHLKVEPHSSKLFTSRDQKKHASPSTRCRMCTHTILFPRNDLHSINAPLEMFWILLLLIHVSGEFSNVQVSRRLS